MIGPFVADQGNKAGCGFASKVSRSSVEGAVAGGVLLDKAPRPCSTQNYGHWTWAVFAMQNGGKQRAIAGEESV